MINPLEINIRIKHEIRFDRLLKAMMVFRDVSYKGSAKVCISDHFMCGRQVKKVKQIILFSVRQTNVTKRVI